MFSARNATSCCRASRPAVTHAACAAAAAGAHLRPLLRHLCICALQVITRTGQQQRHLITVCAHVPHGLIDGLTFDSLAHISCNEPIEFVALNSIGCARARRFDHCVDRQHRTQITAYYIDNNQSYAQCVSRTDRRIACLARDILTKSCTCEHARIVSLSQCVSQQQQQAEEEAFLVCLLLLPVLLFAQISAQISRSSDRLVLRALVGAPRR